MNDQFDNWFDAAILNNVFKLTTPSAQYHAAKAAWEAALIIKQENTLCKLPVPSEKLSYVFTPDPNDEHLSGYIQGKIKDEWETVIFMGGIFFEIYPKKLTYDEIRNIIISRMETASMDFNWKHIKLNTEGTKT